MQEPFEASLSTLIFMFILFIYYCNVPCFYKTATLFFVTV